MWSLILTLIYLLSRQPLSTFDRLVRWLSIFFFLSSVFANCLITPRSSFAINIPYPVPRAQGVDTTNTTSCWDLDRSILFDDSENGDSSHSMQPRDNQFSHPVSSTTGET